MRHRGRGGNYRKLLTTKSPAPIYARAGQIGAPWAGQAGTRGVHNQTELRAEWFPSNKGCRVAPTPGLRLPRAIDQATRRFPADDLPVLRSSTMS